jgi:hypothetical protein
MRAGLLVALFASLAAGLPYDPHGLVFDRTGLPPAYPGHVSIPAARRFQFYYNATSEAPCTQVRKMLRVLNNETGALVARPTELPADDGGSLFVGSNNTVSLRAMVLVPDAAPETWAVADLHI